MATEAEQQARISVDGLEIWTGDWFKVWKVVLGLVADQRSSQP